LAFLVGMTGLAAWGYLGEHRTRPSQGGEDEGLIEKLLFEFGYSLGDGLLVLEGDDLFGTEAIAATRRVVAALEALDGVARVLSLDRIPRAGALLAPLLPAEGAPSEAFAAARELALDHPLVAGHLVARDGRTWVLPILFDYRGFAESSARGEAVDAATQLRAALAEVSLPEGLRASLTGTLMMASDSEAAFQREQILYHSIAYVLVFALATLLFRGFWAVILAGGGPVLGVLWTFGWLEILGLELSSLTLILLPVMIMMIGFTDSVHLMVHIRRERSAGQGPREATLAALRLLALPCFLTTLTTGLGFASLLLARSELVRNFGLACAIGVLCTFLAVMSFLPFCASSFLGRYLRERDRSALVNGALPHAERALCWIFAHPRAITLCGCLLTVLALVHGAAIETENRVAVDIPGSSASARALRRIEQAFGGSVPMRIIVAWSEERGEDAAAIVAAVRAARATLEPERERSEPFALTDLLDYLVGPGGDPALGLELLSRLPAEVAQGVLHAEARTSQIEVLLPDRGYRHFEPMFERLEEQLVGLGPAHPGFEFHLAGQAVLSGRLFTQFTEDLMESLGLAALTILAVMTLAFRSLRLGLISVVPNVFPLAATASLLVLLDLPMAGATAFVMSLGIAVDDTIHFMTRFRHEFKLDGDLDAAIRRTFLRVGKALLMTTVVLVAGFASVLTSDFPRNRVFAGMVCITILSALVCDLVLLPAMLRTFGPGRRLLRLAGHQTRRTRKAQ
jgi:predicted RND superfamily exporter protein